MPLRAGPVANPVAQRRRAQWRRGRSLIVASLVGAATCTVGGQPAFAQIPAAEVGGTVSDATKAVDAVLDTITETLRRRDSVTFTGFGKFSTAHRAAREGVNPRNPSEKVHIPAATVPKFSAGSQLKSAVKGG